MTDPLLPDRLFATDHYPTSRLNVYSKLDLLTFIHHHMGHMPEFQINLDSQFGKLFKIHANRYPISAKLIHGLLSRQLISKNKYCMHTVFGGHPLRFSLKEFGVVTGLNCSEFPESHEPYFNPPTPTEPDAFWKELFGDDLKTTLADIAKEMESGELEEWKMLRYALILIVNGVLIASLQYPKPTPKYVNMLSNLDAFLAFPWGRESFLKTLPGMRPGKKPEGKNEDMFGQYRQSLQQSTYALKGFSIALQLVAYEAIPLLLARLPNGADSRTVIDIPSIKIPQHSGVNLNAILEAENSPNLAVRPRLELENPPDETWGDWPDEYRDVKVVYMDELIDGGHVFKKSDWPSGDSSLPRQVARPVQPNPPKAKNTLSLGGS